MKLTYPNIWKEKMISEFYSKEGAANFWGERIMDLTLEEIKEKYPKPQKTIIPPGESFDACYCVGGAFLLSAFPNCGLRFPEQWALAQGILRYHGLWDFTGRDEIHINNAYALAEIIIASNDNGQYEAAWATLAKALVRDNIWPEDA